MDIKHEPEVITHHETKPHHRYDSFWVDPHHLEHLEQEEQEKVPEKPKKSAKTGSKEKYGERDHSRHTGMSLGLKPSTKWLHKDEVKNASYEYLQ